MMQHNRLGQAFGPGYVGAVGPGAAGQASTSAYLALASSLLDMSDGSVSNAWYQLSEIGGANGVTVKVQVSLDNATWFDISTTSYVANGTGTTAVSHAIAAGTSVLVNLPIAPRFAQVVIEDTSSGSHGTLTGVGYGH